MIRIAAEFAGAAGCTAGKPCEQVVPKMISAGGVSATGRRPYPFNRCYLILLRLVANESFAMKVAPHQSEPGPPGLIGVLATPLAV